VLSDFGGKFANVSELLTPSLDLGKVLRHVGAGVELLGDLEANLDDLKGTLGNVIPAATFELADCLLELVGHFFATSIARLNLFKVVLTDHAFNEASKNVVNLKSGALRCSNHRGRRNVLKEGVSHFTEVLARGEEVIGCPRGLSGAHVVLDVSLRVKPVVSHILSKLLRLGEDLGHTGNFFQVIADLSARLERRSKRVDEVRKVPHEVNDFQMCDIVPNFLNVAVEFSNISHASLDVLEVIVASDGEDEASDEFRHSSDSILDLESWGLDWANSFSKCHGGINTSLEVGLRCPVGLLLGDILLDGASMKEPVLANGLSKLLRLSEDGGP